MTVTFTPDADWLAFDPHPSKPGYVPPPGAVDAHCHVFGPGDVFPYAPERKYTPTDAGKDDLFARRDFLGFERNVIVQGTCHGADNRALADALRTAGDRARGVATIRPGVSLTGSICWRICKSAAARITRPPAPRWKKLLSGSRILPWPRSRAHGWPI